ncbi:hypothetical protein [Natrinema versiforme]|uniref:Uncharacterized protein n=1 Tax=Natrinema versiforme JCM 10478 TaxID=1227496 RepID=L9Y031_9EURY|nr:hypothetical protein [Natrinema versiforme]ELY67459.1 hypothetical protein C489_10224 [Natrinema versiforme JCM 10478]
MSQRDTTTETGDSSAAERRIPKIDDGPLAGALGAVRRGVGSGVPAGVAGLASLLGGVRALRHGDRDTGYLRLGAGGLLVAIALDQRRAAGDRDIDATDVVDTTPDIGDLETEDAGGEHYGGDAASEVVDTGTGIDIEDAEPADSSPDRDGGVDAANVDQTDIAEPGIDGERLADALSESPAADEPDASEPAAREPYERLGAAAFDEHSSEVPIPQAAFDRTILSLRSEVFWGIREADDAVIVSGQFDPIQDGDGIRYVASSEVDGNRLLTIPDPVLNHWDTVAGGGLAVASGTDLSVLTTDALQADDQLRIVPEQWLEDTLESGE